MKPLHDLISQIDDKSIRAAWCIQAILGIGNPQVFHIDAKDSNTLWYKNQIGGHWGNSTIDVWQTHAYDHYFNTNGGPPSDFSDRFTNEAPT